MSRITSAMIQAAAEGMAESSGAESLDVISAYDDLARAAVEGLLAAGYRIVSEKLTPEVRAVMKRCEDGSMSFAEAWAAMIDVAAPRALAKHQPCGCVICTCSHPTQCQGCGSKHCGTHPIDEIPNAVYECESIAPQTDDPLGR